MLIINLFGTPGSGKSTGAAYVFSRLKLAGINAELVTEFAKDKVYEESKEVFNNQAYIFGKQYFRVSRLIGKVDVVVTDSPLLLSIFYNKSNVGKAYFDSYVRSVHNEFKSLNYFVVRNKPYSRVGRFQSEEESNEMKDRMLCFLKSNCESISEITGDADGYNRIVDAITSRI